MTIASTTFHKIAAWVLLPATCMAVSQPSGMLFDLPDGLRQIRTPDIYEAAAAVTTAAYPDADSAIIDSICYESYNPDGTSTVFDDTFTKVLTEKGRRGEATASLGFDAFYTGIEVLAAEILKPDGTVTCLDTNAVCAIATDTRMMSSNIYDPNDKVMTVAYPGLEIGDIVRLAIVRREKRARVPGVWSSYEVFESGDPILRYTYSVSSPTNLPIARTALRDAIPGTLESQEALPQDGGSRTLHTWNFANVPQVFPEPSMPPMHTVCQRLLLSTANDWRELSRWYWNLSLPHLEKTTGEMLELTKSLYEPTDVESEKIWKIFTWVSQKIRYMGITTETESPGYEPHDVSATFERRHGVCRDKAALLVAMLRLADVDAYPVLIHVGERRDQEVPMTFFNHAIVGVREADGEFMLMDPTNENSADLLPPYLAGKSFLAATPDGETLRTSPEIPAAANMLFISTKAKVDSKGGVAYSTKMDFTGLNDSSYRGALARMAAENRKRFLENLVKAFVPGSELSSFSIFPGDLSDTETPLSIRLEASVPEFLSMGTDADTLRIPRFSNSIGFHNFLIESTGLVKRRFALETEEACGAEESIEIDFDSIGNAIALPDNASFRTNGITYWQRAFANTGDSDIPPRLTASSRIEFNLTSYPPEIYMPLKETLSQIDTLSSQLAVFKPSPPPEEANADSLILDTATFVDIASPTSWSVTVKTSRKILTYAGRRQFSELKFNYNPAWQDVELIHASVSNQNGRVQLVTDDEINVMDAPWVASAPRYPAGKTFVASLPGVEIGSIIDTTVKLTQRDAPFFSYSHTFNGTTPRLRDRLAMRYPRDLDSEEGHEGQRLISELYNPEGLSEPEFIDDGDHVIASFEAVKPRTIPRQPDLPDAANYAMMLATSTGNWRDYAKALKAAIDKSIAPANAQNCGKVAGKLCEKLEEPADKIVAIRDYVLKNIRLAGPSFQSIPLSPTPADTILADGYGNLLDRAIVISAMLIEVGIDNSIVFASSSEIQEEIAGRVSHLLAVPARGTFDYPLVDIPIDDEGGHIYLNDSDQYAELGIFHHHHRYALTTTDDPENGIPFPDAHISMGADDAELDFGPIRPLFLEDRLLPWSTRSYSISLDADGNAKITMEKFVNGPGADYFLKQHTEMTPERRRRHAQNEAGLFAKTATPEGDMSIGTNSLPYSLKLAIDAPKFGVRTGKLMSISIPHKDDFVDVGGEVRRLPFAIGGEIGEQTTVEILLPPETVRVIAKPEAMHLKYADLGLGDFERVRAVETDGETGRLLYREITSRTMHPGGVFGPELHGTLREIKRLLTRDSSDLLIIELNEGGNE